MVPNWCRFFFGAKVVPNKIGRGARCPNSKFCYGFTPLENWGAFWAATKNWARNWGGIWAEIGAPIGAPIGARCLDAKIGAEIGAHIGAELGARQDLAWGWGVGGGGFRRTCNPTDIVLYLELLGLSQVCQHKPHQGKPGTRALGYLCSCNLFVSLFFRAAVAIGLCLSVCECCCGCCVLGCCDCCCISCKSEGCDLRTGLLMAFQQSELWVCLQLQGGLARVPRKKRLKPKSCKTITPECHSLFPFLDAFG